MTMKMVVKTMMKQAMVPDYVAGRLLLLSVF